MGTAIKAGRIPHGVADLFFEGAAEITECERRLHEQFLSWGYGRIIPPTFEFYNMLVTGSNEALQDRVFRFVDREGQLLALRPDMTVPTARIAASKLYDQPMPLRFYYIGRVFRYEEPQAGRQREFTQAGIELLGADTVQADAEVLALAIETLRTLGLADFQINLGHVGFMAALLRQSELDDAPRRRLELAIDRRNPLELDQVLAEYGVEGATAQALRTLPSLSGGRPILAAARQLSTGEDAEQALARLEAVYDRLEQWGYARYIILDLGETRNMAYYTGIAFRGYIKGLGFPVCGGGRYDQLLANFGNDLPAVGFAISLERALVLTKPEVSAAPDMLVSAPAALELGDLLGSLRQSGWCIQSDVLELDEAALIEQAASRGISMLLLTAGEGYRIIRDNTTRDLLRAELEKELSVWTR
ncbi:MAG: ATP phosphoribosyltransferase regulatory subunit [Chloroflexi bacterium]|nr:ATP phosphoribosyltransferase regulatory subunit [Chloroflexota bacterium]